MKSNTDNSKLDEAKKKLIAAAMKGTREYYRNCANNGSDFNLDSCKNSELEAIVTYTRDNSCVYMAHREALQNARAIASSLANELDEARSAQLLRMKRSVIAGQMKMTTAQVMIDDLFGMTGLEYEATYQKYRAKVYVKLGTRGYSLLYIYYNDLMARDMSRLPTILQEMTALIGKK